MQTPPDPTPTESDPAPTWLGRWSFGLALASGMAYFAASEGIRNFVGFVLGLVKRVLAMTGHA